MDEASSPFSRSSTLLGAEGMARLAAKHVFIFGVGGVGGWCAEALVRTGVGAISIVDGDVVAPSNINRQVMATSATIGRPKVEVLSARLREINPSLEIAAYQMRFSAETEDFFAEKMALCNVVVDAIDSVEDKCRLIRLCERNRWTVFSSLGAARRLDPSKVASSPFDRVAGDPLARVMRNRFRRESALLPNHLCVYSIEEPLKTNGLGSIMPVTATFGMMLASLVIAR